jgi:hypothetical protein
VLTFKVEPKPSEDTRVEYRIEENIDVSPDSSKTLKELLITRCEVA